MKPSRIKKAPCTIALILALLVSAVAGLQLVNLAIANPSFFLPYITIKSDGSVEPKTEYIKQEGNVYTLTDDLVRTYAIRIQSSNITFDGGGHVINGFTGIAGYDYSNLGVSLEDVINVTVKDIEITGFMLGWGQADISLKDSTGPVISTSLSEKDTSSAPASTASSNSSSGS